MKDDSQPIEMTSKKKKYNPIRPEPTEWLSNGKKIPFSEMSDSHLRKAKLAAQKKELEHFNRADYFGRLSEALDKEAETRDIEIPDYDSEFHKKARRIKNK